MDIKTNYLKAIYQRNPQWVPVSDEAVKTIYPPVCERPAEAGKDAFGCEWFWKEEAQGGTFPGNSNYVITDISKWKEQMKLPDLNAYDWSLARKQAEQVDREKYLVGGFIEMGIFERSYLLMGMEEALIAYYTNEDEMYELAAAIADYKIEFLKKYHAEINMDILWYGDDWGTQNNLFISPETWRKIIKPHTKRIYDCAKSLGIIVNQHSCGKIEAVLGDMIEMGADCWNPCQPCNDLAQLKKEYGAKICFIGGVDSQFVLDNPKADANDVVLEVKRRIDEMALPNGGYIVGPSHSVPYNPEKLEAMDRTIREYGREVYQIMRSETIQFDYTSDSIVSPLLFGSNLEHTRNCVHKGISAEMLENRKFAGKPGANNGCATHWKPVGKKVYCALEAPYTRHAEDYHMKRDLECNAQRFTAFTDGEECGICQSGLVVEKDQSYQLSMAVKACGTGTLAVSLTEGEEILCVEYLKLEKSEDFAEKELTLIPKKSSEQAVLNLTIQNANTVTIGAVSLLPANHFHGMRPDVIALLKEMGVKILRWPGGNFAGEYNWKDGLLPRNMRAPLQSYLGLETQPHSMGYDFHEINTDDFVALCKEIGAEPFITLNPTWNTPEESAQWVEYCNGDENTEYGRLRISRGYPEPYKVNFWSLGNEFGYGHMEGANVPCEYSKMGRQHAEAMQKVSNDLTFCSSGPYPNKEWTMYSAKALSDIAPLVSLHFYNEYPKFTEPLEYENEYRKFMDGVETARDLARTLRKDLNDDKIRISFDEWNAWYAWYRSDSVCDGIFAAAMLHMFIQEAEKTGIDMVCHFEAVNEGAILVESTSAKLTSMGKMFTVMKKHAMGKLLYCTNDVVATELEGIISVSLINTAYKEEKVYRIPVCGEIQEAEIYEADQILPHSVFEKKDIACQAKEGYYEIIMPPHSVALLRQKK